MAVGFGRLYAVMRKKRLLAILAIGERSRGELAGPAQEAQVAVAVLQASA